MKYLQISESKFHNLTESDMCVVHLGTGQSGTKPKRATDVGESPTATLKDKYVYRDQRIVSH